MKSTPIIIAILLTVGFRFAPAQSVFSFRLACHSSATELLILSNTGKSVWMNPVSSPENKFSAVENIILTDFSPFVISALKDILKKITVKNIYLVKGRENSPLWKKVFAELNLSPDIKIMPLSRYNYILLRNAEIIILDSRLAQDNGEKDVLAFKLIHEKNAVLYSGNMTGKDYSELILKNPGSESDMVILAAPELPLPAEFQKAFQSSFKIFCLNRNTKKTIFEEAYSYFLAAGQITEWESNGKEFFLQGEKIPQ